MNKQPGYIVETKLGLYGRTKHSDHRINGKVIVYLEEDYKPVLDDKGHQKKLLCNMEELKIVGFSD